MLLHLFVRLWSADTAGTYGFCNSSYFFYTRPLFSALTHQLEAITST